jgi:DNA invertase Pin-like site-specific DNA recombinase
VVRPGFEQLLTDLASGLIDGICVWDSDRLARQPRDLERLIDLYETRKVWCSLPPTRTSTSQPPMAAFTPD